MVIALVGDGCVLMNDEVKVEERVNDEFNFCFSSPTNRPIKRNVIPFLPSLTPLFLGSFRIVCGA